MHCMAIAQNLRNCPVRSVVRTIDFHSINRGSIPLRGTIWKHSSVGRAPALQAGGHWFKSSCFHHLDFESTRVLFFYLLSEKIKKS